MEHISFRKILASEKRLDGLLIKLGIPITKHDRVHAAYNLISGLEDARRDDAKRKSFLEANNKSGEVTLSLSDIHVIYNVIPYLKDQNEQIVKDKIKKILNGTLSSQETPQNSIARNTLFELSLFAYLRAAGMSVELRDPNPDLLLRNGGRNYYIQCKRVFREKPHSIKSNIKEAARQLNNDLKNSYDWGVIALSVERVFNEGNKILLIDNEVSGREVVYDELKKFIVAYGRFWQATKIVKNDRIIAVLCVMSNFPVANLEDGTQATGFFVLGNNTRIPIQPAFKQFEADFQPAKKYGLRGDSMFKKFCDMFRKLRR